MSTDKPVCEAAGKIGELVIALGQAPINNLEGAWTYQLDDSWFLAINGHGEPVKVPNAPERMGFDLQPYDFAVWYNGWLAGTFNAFGEGCIAAGSGANETALLEALEAKLRSLQ